MFLVGRIRLKKYQETEAEPRCTRRQASESHAGQGRERFWGHQFMGSGFRALGLRGFRDLGLKV